MLWPKNSFGVVTWPCAFAVVVAATNTIGSKAARQVRNLRIDIQNLRKVGKARSELRLASVNTRQKWRLLVPVSEELGSDSDCVSTPVAFERLIGV